jgi:hypothetical protein
MEAKDTAAKVQESDAKDCDCDITIVFDAFCYHELCILLYIITQ